MYPTNNYYNNSIMKLLISTKPKVLYNNCYEIYCTLIGYLLSSILRGQTYHFNLCMPVAQVVAPPNW